MNERIKELAVQAGYTKDMFGIGHWDMPECKKFAELIVQECAEVIFKTPVEYLEIDAMHRVRDRVKEHFGVVE